MNGRSGLRPRTKDHPDWIRGKICWDSSHNAVETLLKKLGLSSVCVEALCPNRGECWKEKHVSFLIMGDICTRSCRFCGVETGKGNDLDPSEPQKIASVIKELGIKYAVITSVTRDDLPDKGAGHFTRTVKEIKKLCSGTLVELLIPDMDSSDVLLREVALSGAEIIGHNIEMPEALYPGIRPEADYSRSLKTLSILNGIKNEGAPIRIKSSLMAGLGENTGDIIRTLKDLRTTGVEIVYIGQYLSPSSVHWPIKKYYTPQEFKFLENEARNIGFSTVMSAPMVRSSYRTSS